MSRPANQLTIRGFDPELAERIRRLAYTKGISLNAAAIELLRRGAGLEQPGLAEPCVGSTLDDLLGTWSEEQARELEEAVLELEHIDDELWQ